MLERSWRTVALLIGSRKGFDHLTPKAVINALAARLTLLLHPKHHQTQDCPAGTRLIELPSSCLLTYDPERADPKLLALIEQVGGLDEQALGDQGWLELQRGAQVTGGNAVSAIMNTAITSAPHPTPTTPSFRTRTLFPQTHPTSILHHAHTHALTQVPEELWGGRLALALLAARAAGPDSPFAAYLSHLPRGFSGVPIFYSRESIEAIDYPPVVEQVRWLFSGGGINKGSSVLCDRSCQPNASAMHHASTYSFAPRPNNQRTQVKKRCRWLYRFSSDALASLPGTAADPFGGAAVDMNSLGGGWGMGPLRCRCCGCLFTAAMSGLSQNQSANQFNWTPSRKPTNHKTLKTAGWGLAAVTSRAFRVRGPTHPAALLPLVDMANHSFTPNAEVVPGRDGGVVMLAKREVGGWGWGLRVSGFGWGWGWGALEGWLEWVWVGPSDVS